ncbi:MAG: hypothetical protein EOM55_04810 [Clostridia bacterium]|nr:hypothetical protein [Clostridia bacterium]
MEWKKVFTILVNGERQILTLRHRAFDFAQHSPPLELMEGRYELRNFGQIEDVQIRIAIVDRFNLDNFSILGCQMVDIGPFIRHHPDDFAVLALKKGFASYYL